MPSPILNTTVLSYNDWNEAVGRYCFNPTNAGKQVRLAVDPLVLQRTAAEGHRRHHFPTPEMASDDFRTAVTRHIDKYGWNIGQTVCGAFPAGLAKLALQVLAVFGISPDDEGGSSYWVALLESLGRVVVKRGVKPEDLELETHQRNWFSLAHWANELNKGRLGRIPTPETGGRRHVRLPLSHGLLRREDIQGLHRFFHRIGLAPGEDIDPDDIMSDLRLYADDASIFRGAHARRLLQDERLPLAADQIVNAVAQWDGQRVDLAKSQRPAVRLWLTVHTTGSGRVSGGLVQLDPKSNLGTEVSGVTLLQLFGRDTVRQLHSPVVYRPIEDCFVVTVRSLIDERFVESRHLRPGDQSVIARPTSVDGQRFERELHRIAVTGRVIVYGEGTHGVPVGWLLYCFRVREDIQESDVPSVLRGRIKIRGIRLRVFGGLRVRRTWIEGAGPTVAVIGGDVDAIIIDGVEYTVTDGFLYPERCMTLNELGIHEAWVPGRHRDRVRFRVANPKPAKFDTPYVEAGWGWNAAPEWPSRLLETRSSECGSVRGPVIDGAWLPVPASIYKFLPVERIAIQLVVAIRKPKAAGRPATISALKEACQKHPNLLIRQLVRAVGSNAGARQR